MSFSSEDYYYWKQKCRRSIRWQWEIWSKWLDLGSWITISTTTGVWADLKFLTTSWMPKHNHWANLLLPQIRRRTYCIASTPFLSPSNFDHKKWQEELGRCFYVIQHQCPRFRSRNRGSGKYQVRVRCSGSNVPAMQVYRRHIGSSRCSWITDSSVRRLYANY